MKNQILTALALFGAVSAAQGSNEKQTQVFVVPGLKASCRLQMGPETGDGKTVVVKVSESRSEFIVFLPKNPSVIASEIEQKIELVTDTGLVGLEPVPLEQLAVTFGYDARGTLVPVKYVYRDLRPRTNGPRLSDRECSGLVRATR